METTGRSVAEAKELALDQLGVAAEDAEFEVLEEERTGLFGRLRREARVRARVRPAPARAKVERHRERGGNRRGRGGGKQGRRRGRDGQDTGEGKAGGKGPPKADRQRTEKPKGQRDEKREPSREGSTGREGARRKGGGSSGGRAKQTEADRGAGSGRSAQKEQQVSEPVTLEQQAEIVEDFLDGLLDAFDADGEISDETVDDGETLEVRINGDDLGLLIGPRGNTLQAIQELARAALQRQSDGPLEGRLRLDIAGYRSRRRDALESFTRSRADEVLSDGRERALEPMPPADRKIVHDTVNEIDGVSTISEGEDSNRRVVIVPDAD